MKLHAKWGGVVPGLAKREHTKNLPKVLDKALKQAKIKTPEKEIDYVAVTIGPGLESALWTGINFGRNLVEEWNKPIIPVNHMEGHLFSPFLKSENFKIPKINFPAIALLVSGGHTQLVLIKNLGKYKILGETRDDAAGEVFDKVARMLNLGYPGGPAISKLTSNPTSSVGGPTSNRYDVKLPRPMISDNSPDGEFDFSYSGLKTAVLYKIKELKSLPRSAGLTPSIKKEICHEFQQSVIDVLISKALKATEKYKAKTVILGGGVVVNKELKKQFKENLKDKNIDLLIPNIKFSGDNAAMIALASYFQKKKPVRSTGSLQKGGQAGQALKANGNLRIG